MTVRSASRRHEALCIAIGAALFLVAGSFGEARADAIKKGVSVDNAKVQEKLLKCIDKFDGGTKGFEKGCIGKLEGKQKQDNPDTVCAVTGDLAALEAKADAFVADIVSEITSVP